MLVACFLLFPFIVMTVVKIREIQIYYIDENSIPGRLKKSDRHLKISGFIGLFLPILSLAALSFSDAIFGFILGLLFLCGGTSMISAYVAIPFFLIPAVIYIMLFFVSVIFYKSLSVMTALIIALVFLQQSIPEIIQLKKIRQSSVK